MFSIECLRYRMCQISVNVTAPQPLVVQHVNAAVKWIFVVACLPSVLLMRYTQIYCAWEKEGNDALDEKDERSEIYSGIEIPPAYKQRKKSIRRL